MKRWRITLSQLSNISRSRAVVASKKKGQNKALEDPYVHKTIPQNEFPGAA
jgi:hypothetical protein